MPKNRAGLHKGVSAIFAGKRIQKEEGTQQPPRAPALEHTDSAFAKTPAPSHMTPTEPEPQQSMPLRTGKTAPSKQQTTIFSSILRRIAKLGPSEKTDTPRKSAGQSALQKKLEQIKNKLFEPKEGVSPTRQKVMVVLVPVLFVVMVIVFTQVLKPSSGRATEARTIKPSGAIASSNNKIDWKIPELYPTTLRDPMEFGPVTSTADTQADTGKLIVKGIVYSKDNPSAVIGDEIVYEGDIVSGITIVKINRDSVEFEKDGKKWTQKVQR